MKLLTFLGAGAAHETTYILEDGRSHTANYCGVALARFHPEADMRVFVTEEARATHWEAFAAGVEDHVASLQPVPIPVGRSESDLWGIFQAVVEQVAREDEVIFDITHGFRSLPFLSFLAAAYLRVIRDIKLHAVYYGNYELRDKSVTPSCAPVIDLTRFVELLDWTVAADRFVRLGDAQDLAQRLYAAQPHYTIRQQDHDARAQGIQLGQAAGTMTQVSQALQLLRPAEAMQASEELQERINTLAGIANLNILPFRQIAEQVKDTYAELAMHTDGQRQHPVEALRIERQMIHWHIARHQYVQAVGLAREWLVTWVMLQARFRDPLDKSLRLDVENAIGAAMKERERQRGAFGPYHFSTGVELREIPKIAQALDLYSRIGTLRNDIMHAGKRPDPSKASELASQSQKLCQQLDQYPLPVGS